MALNTPVPSPRTPDAELKVVLHRARRSPRITSEHGTWLLVVLLLAFTLRALDLEFNTAFEGESFMVLMGRSILAGGADVTTYMRTAFGWYLWPVVAALTDYAGGLTALRLLAALLGTCAVGGVFLFTRRLFDERTALAAALLSAAFTPALLASRVATPDAAGMALLACTLALFARAAQTGTWSAWIWASCFAIATVLVKHSLAGIIPVLCLLAPVLDRRRGLLFTLTVTAVLAVYATWYVSALQEMVASASSGPTDARAEDGITQSVLREHLDVVLLVLLSLAALVQGNRETRQTIGVLLLGALSLTIVPSSLAFDPHAWSHLVYPTMLLLPAAACGGMGLADRIVRRDNVLVGLVMTVVAGSVFLLGGHGLAPMRRGVPAVWPNTRIVAEFLQTRVLYGQHLLVDDASVRYVLADVTPQRAIADEHAFAYDGLVAPTSYARAVAAGLFDYVVLDGNDTDGARALHAAIEPVLSGRYAERFRGLQPATGEDAVIYERIYPPVTRPDSAPRIVLETPQPNATVIASGARPSAMVSGFVERAPAGSRLRIDVYTDVWYVQGPMIPATGARSAFSRRVVLGGEGPHRCQHAIRVRLLGSKDRILHEVQVNRVRRASADSVSIPCTTTDQA